MIVLCFVAFLGSICFIANTDRKNALLFSFYLLFLFLSLRIELGSDYIEYEKIYNLFVQNSNVAIERIELGWLYLNKIFSLIVPFQLFITLLSFFYCLVFYHLIINWGIPKYYYLSVLILFINPNLTLIQSSALRQSLAILIFLFSLKYLLTHKYLKYISCIFLASLFHVTAIHLIILPIVFYFTNKMSLFIKLILFFTFISLFIFREYYIDVMHNIVTAFFSVRYDLLLNTNSNFSLLNLVVYASLMILLLFNYKYQETKIKPFFIISIIGLFYFPLDLIIPLSGRLGYYYFPISIITYPHLVNKMNSKWLRTMFLTVLILIYLYRLYGMYTSETYDGAFNSYKTIFNR